MDLRTKRALDREGDIVWEFLTPYLDERGHRATIERVKRYPRERIESFLAAD